MDRLLNLVQTYRQTEGLDFRLQLAEGIVCEITHALRTFIMGHCPFDWVDDVLQNTLVSITLDLPRCSATSAGVLWSRWYLIAERRIADAFRERGRHPTEEIDLDKLWEMVEQTAIDPTISPADRIDLKEALEVLRNTAGPCFEYLWDYAFLGWDYSEIAERRGVTPDAARMRIQRCLEAVPKRMGKGR
jgi:DNA-directed RNA polymerase specialized sigma24 family protein